MRLRELRYGLIGYPPAKCMPGVDINCKILRGIGCRVLAIACRLKLLQLRRRCKQFIMHYVPAACIMCLRSMLLW